MKKKNEKKKIVYCRFKSIQICVTRQKPYLIQLEIWMLCLTVFQSCSNYNFKNFLIKNTILIYQGVDIVHEDFVAEQLKSVLSDMHVDVVSQN